MGCAGPGIVDSLVQTQPAPTQLVTDGGNPQTTSSLICLSHKTRKNIANPMPSQACHEDQIEWLWFVESIF